MNFMKIVGLFLVFAVCTLGGFYLSERLTQRRRTLRDITVAIEEISYRVGLGQERGEIFKKVFDGKSLKVSEDENYTVLVSARCLRAEDIAFLNEFFSRLGNGDVPSQQALCKTYKKLFEKNCESARAEEQAKGQMYKTCGFLTAAALIIFII